MKKLNWNDRLPVFSPITKETETFTNKELLQIWENKILNIKTLRFPILNKRYQNEL